MRLTVTEWYSLTFPLIVGGIMFLALGGILMAFHEGSQEANSWSVAGMTPWRYDIRAAGVFILVIGAGLLIIGVRS